MVTSEHTVYLNALCAVGLLIFGTLCSWRFPSSNTPVTLGISCHTFSAFYIKAVNLDLRILLNVHASYKASEVQAAYDLNTLTECQI